MTCQSQEDNHKINIALLWPKYGGNTTSVNDLIVRLERNHFNAIFIYLSNIGAKANYLEKLGFKTYYLSNIYPLNAFRFSILFKLKKILQDNKIDILHCHGHKATIYGGIATLFVKHLKLVAHIHGLNRTFNLRRKIINFFIYRNFNKLLPVANAVKDDVLRSNWCLNSKKLFVLENSIDFNLYAESNISKQQAKKMLGVQQNTFVFGNIARLVPTKGIEILIKAFQKAKRNIPNAELVLIGDGRNRTEYESFAASNEYYDCIHFLGRKQNIAQLLRGIDIFVISSIAEGMPRVLLEAMAASVPCIATNVGGILEIINSPEFGILVSSNDSDSLAKVMVQVSNMSKKQLDIITANAKKLVHAKYSHDTMAKKLAAVYRELYEM